MECVYGWRKGAGCQEDLYREKEVMNRDKGGRNGGTKGKGKSAGEDEITM